MKLERRARQRLGFAPPRSPAPSCSTFSSSPTSSAPTGSARFWGYPQSRAFAELLTDCDEDRVLRAVVVGMLREMGRSSLVRYACGDRSRSIRC
jgi:hypothetical protein